MQLADRFGRPDVFTMLSEMTPDELSLWVAYFSELADRSGDVQMKSPDEWEQECLTYFSN